MPPPNPQEIFKAISSDMPVSSQKAEITD
jgi:hypothetical protein